MADFKTSLEQVAEDLMNLEVNTIIRNNMTARKMPSPAHALLDIARTYGDKLLSTGFSPRPLLKLAGEQKKDGLEAIEERMKEWAEQQIESLKEVEEGSEEQTKERNMRAMKERAKELLGGDGNFSEYTKIDATTFAALRWTAKVALYVESDTTDEALLLRIKRNSDQLKVLLEVLKDGPFERFIGKNRTELLGMETGTNNTKPLNPKHLALIRKTWEIGMEWVAMQTVIQLDGDVINRIQKSYANKEYAYLHQIHAQGVQVSVQFWQILADTLSKFMGSLAKFFT